MSKTIRKLWNGELDPIRYLGLYNTEIKHLESLVHGNFEKLKSACDQISIEVLETYKDCVDEYVLLIAQQSFCDGFSLGVKLIAEALTRPEE